jgi:hypothetical protein
MDVDLVLPDHCEITDKTNTPLYKRFQELLGYSGAFCTTTYAQDGPLVGGVFQPNEKPSLTFDSPQTKKMVFHFHFPPFEYVNAFVNFNWEFNFISAEPLLPWTVPVNF